MKKWLICAAILIAAVPAAQAQITSKHIDNALKKNLVHPYLFFTEEEKPAILDRIENDPETGHIMARIHRGVAATAEQYAEPGDYLAGANICGFQKVARAMIDQGVI